MKLSAVPVALVAKELLTVTSTVVPTVPAGAVAVIEVALTTTTFVAATLPNLTLVAPVKLVPVIVTGVPPAGRPATGLTAVTVGVP